MGEVLEFCVGCRHCANLARVGKNTYCCQERVHMDDTPVMPIVDGKHTEDWNACEGEDYKRIARSQSRTS